MSIKEGLHGRTVLVFGACGALGSGVATAFAASGALVTGADRSVPGGDITPGAVPCEAVDVLDDAAIRALFDNRPTPWAVINTVGGFAPQRPLAELDRDELTSQLDPTS